MQQIICMLCNGHTPVKISMYFDFWVWAGQVLCRKAAEQFALQLSDLALLFSTLDFHQLHSYRGQEACDLRIIKCLLKSLFIQFKSINADYR